MIMGMLLHRPCRPWVSLLVRCGYGESTNKLRRVQDSNEIWKLWVHEIPLYDISNEYQALKIQYHSTKSVLGNA